MKKFMFSIAGAIIALIFWFFDASIHYFVYGEPEFEYVPMDFNELWMRTTIVVLMILFGVFADYFTNKIMYKKKQLEGAAIYTSMIYASHHILKNLLTQMQLFRIEAARSSDFNQEFIKSFDVALEEATNLVNTMFRVENMSKDNLWLAENTDDTVDK